MAHNISSIRNDFPNLKVTVRDMPLVYLDNAASTFKPQCVIDTIHQHYSYEVANVHRGIHYLSEQASVKYERVRETVRAFLNAKHKHEIIFTKGTTDSINLVAASLSKIHLQPGDEVLITEMEHHSNIVPWQMACEASGARLVVAPVNDQGELIFDQFLKLLNGRTRIVSVVHASNSLGSINPVKKIIAAAHQVSAAVLVDAAQSISDQFIDVQDLDCEFLAFSSHKLFGPTGVGVLYGKEAWLDRMPPYQGGGDMIKSVSFEKTVYNDLPFKFEAGTPHIAGVIGLGSAIDYVLGIGLDYIHEYKQTLVTYGHVRLSSIPKLTLLGTAAHKTSIFSFVIKDIHPHDLGTIIDEQGVAVRTGHHCTEPLMKRFGVVGTTRASLSIYNTMDEIDALVKAIEKSMDILL